MHDPGKHVFYTKYAVFFDGDKIIVMDGIRAVERKVEGVTLLASSSGWGDLVLYSNGSHAWLSYQKVVEFHAEEESGEFEKKEPMYCCWTEPKSCTWREPKYCNGTRPKTCCWTEPKYCERKEAKTCCWY
ncbi:MAG: hypothetical protein J7L38_00370 [Thermoproteales archaeon]|nr:hypothetical protein [Thermoproteales archaeon]